MRLTPFWRGFWGVMVAGAVLWSWAVLEALRGHGWPLVAVATAAIIVVSALRLRAP